MTTRSVLALAGMVAVLSACHPTVGEQQIVRRWLLCEECIDGELEAVVPLGDRVTSMLAQALLQGPPASGRAHIRRQARERFDRLPSPAAVGAVRYVDHYDSNYIASYQAHAAVALGRIGTTDARAALIQALQRDPAYRYDVLRELADAAPIRLDTVAGGSQAAPRDSLVRVPPTVLVVDSVTGHPLPNIRVAFRVHSGGGHLADSSVQRTSVNGLASVRWSLGSGPDSLNVLRAVAFRRSLRFHAIGHGLTPRLLFAVQPTNGTRGQSLPVIRVLVLDAWDRQDTTFAATALATILGTPDSVTGPLVAGQLDISDLVPTVSGLGFRIRVQAVGATPAISAPFDVSP